MRSIALALTLALSLVSVAYAQTTPVPTLPQGMVWQGPGVAGNVWNTTTQSPTQTLFPLTGTAVFSATSCTSVATKPEWVTALLDYATASEGAVVTLYNEGASPTCATNDQVLAVTPSNGGPFTFPPFGLYFPAGVAIKWGSAPVTGVRVEMQP